MSVPGTELLQQQVNAARGAGRSVLLETEGLDLVESMGLRVPVRQIVKGPDDLGGLALDRFPGDELVIKVVSPEILHKSDVGGVLVVPQDMYAVRTALRAMARRFAGTPVTGYLVMEYIPHEKGLGRELLLGARWTEDFGPVVTLSPGGIYAEHLAGNLQPGRDVAILSPSNAGPAAMETALAGKILTEVVTGGLRGQSALLDMNGLKELLSRFLAFAAQAMPAQITEFEINPLVLVQGEPVALDVLVKLGREPEPVAPPRPLSKLHCLLRPRQIGIIGVSSRMNPGRIILKKLLREGFDPACIHLIKPGCDTLDGCRCYPDLASLPVTLDLLVLAVAAAQVPAIMEEVVATARAESLIVIPGGLGERSGSQSLEREVRSLIHRSRRTPGKGPLVNGGNCLGIRSRPGRYDTMFIPDYKLPPATEKETPLAVISQSGAWAVARASKLSQLAPRYMISIGNQVDLTVGDYLEALKDERDLQVFACYVEGFRPLDGERWLKAAAEITRSGRTVILYRAGRTPTGARATASHTASVAGDYAVTRELARQAGVLVADTLSDYEDLVRLSCLLRDTRPSGLRLGVLSNAGFECVAVADNLEPFTLPSFTAATVSRVQELFAACRLDKVVDVQNPLDVTPLMNDEAFASAVMAVMADDHVDVGLVGCVPLTGALQTLAAGTDHRENVAAAESLAGRLLQWNRGQSKPWVAVVDGGELYDPMARILERGGVPTFRTADRAMRILDIYCRSRLSRIEVAHGGAGASLTAAKSRWYDCTREA